MRSIKYAYIFFSSVAIVVQEWLCPCTGESITSSQHFCHDDFVFSIKSLVEEKRGESITASEVEKTLDGNICRCTGYRPIMDAFKTFARDGAPGSTANCVDLEVNK